MGAQGEGVRGARREQLQEELPPERRPRGTQSLSHAQYVYIHTSYMSYSQYSLCSEILIIVQRFRR